MTGVLQIANHDHGRPQMTTDDHHLKYKINKIQFIILASYLATKNIKFRRRQKLKEAKAKAKAKMALIFALALASSNFCEYGPKNEPNFDRPKVNQILALAVGIF